MCKRLNLYILNSWAFPLGIREAQESRHSALTSAVRLTLDAGEVCYNLVSSRALSLLAIMLLECLFFIAKYNVVLVQTYHENGNYSTAMQLFKQAFRVSEQSQFSKDVANVSTTSKRKEIFLTDAMILTNKWLDSVIAEEFQLTEVDVPCRLHYWYALSISSGAASDELPVMYNVTRRGEIYEHLSKLQECMGPSDGSSDVTKKMRIYANSQLEEIRFMIEHVDGDLEDP